MDMMMFTGGVVAGYVLALVVEKLVDMYHWFVEKY